VELVCISLVVHDFCVLNHSIGDDSKGYFIIPTVIKTEDPKSITMVEEIFGPVLTVWSCSLSIRPHS
jgi:acyl-CoA reductase-like NAD-dependent aldehyde dehydrogenase